MRLATLLSLTFVILAPAIQAAVLAIDYGAEFTKLSLVKPGVALDVILDRDSKRKIQSVVGWKRAERVFGQEGKMAATRFPDTHYPYVKPLLGVQSPDSVELYPNAPIVGEDGSVVFHHPSDHPLPGAPEQGDRWTPTALLAHQISYYRRLAEDLAGASGTPERITQAIVTVPGWWNTYQRKAFRDALELQGLSCLAMIGEGTGVALNYAMTRQFPTYDPVTGEGEKEYDIIYDSGALSTTATVVAFYQTSVLPFPKAKKAINTTYVEVIGTGYQEIGGVALDVALQKLLAQDFVGKTGKSKILDDKRAMAKLAKEAIRVKQILSANQESNVNIESLFDDIDYRSRITRSQLEEAIEGSAGLFSSPITSALRDAGLTIDQISQVILFGGNTRVPYVQSAVKSVLGAANEDKIANNVNTDEAAVLGAAYYGASLSRQFKMKNIEVIEGSNAAVTLNGEEIFPRGTPLGQKKSIILPVDKATPLQFSFGSHPVLSVELYDLASAVANFTSPSPAVNLTIRLDSRGHVAVANAALVSSVPEEESGGVAGALKGLFGKKPTDDDDSDDVAVDSADASKSEKKPKKKVEKVALRFRESHLGDVKHTTGEDKRKIMGRLTSISISEASKAAREEARNILEGYLYKMSGLLAEDADVKVLYDFATKEERDAISKVVSSTFEWLSEHAETASEKELKEKRKAIEILETPILTRYLERQTRPDAIDNFQKAMFAGRAFHEEAVANVTAALEAAKSATPEFPVAPPKYTEAELKVVEDLLKELTTWVDEKMAKQVLIEDQLFKDPEILTQDLNEKGKALQMTVLRLTSRRDPKAPKPVKPSSSSSSTAVEETPNSSTTAEGTSTSSASESEATEAPDAKHDEL